MNKWWKNALAISGAFVVYKFYKLYELGESVVYEPYKYSLRYSGTNTPDLVVKMKLFNPTGTSVSMRGVDGILKTAKGEVLSTFFSPPFIVKPGEQFYDLIFTINSPQMKSWFNKFFVSSKQPLTLIVKKKLPFFTTTDESQINIQSLIADSLF
jgi:hypothetical protein